MSTITGQNAITDKEHLLLVLLVKMEVWASYIQLVWQTNTMMPLYKRKNIKMHIGKVVVAITIYTMYVGMVVVVLHAACNTTTIIISKLLKKVLINGHV